MANRAALADEGVWDLKSPPNRERVYNDSMPVIPPKVLDSVVYLYSSVAKANARVKSGGTGFFVVREIAGSKGTERGTRFVPYLISNKHVIFSHGSSVVSVNRRDGKPPDVIDFNQDDWTPHPNGDDLAAICVWGKCNYAIHKYSYIDEPDFLTEEQMRDLDVGVGDEVLMVGRFVDYQGRTINRPAARFGNISMMLEKLWVTELLQLQEGFAVEMRSRTGFSGSPVVVYRTPATVLSPDIPPEKMNFWALLGVNWGYVLEDGENTFLNGVVPAWKITELLDTLALKKQQQMIEESFQKQFGDNTSQLASASESAPSTKADNPSHKEDFNSLLTSAATAKQSDDQT